MKELYKIILKNYICYTIISESFSLSNNRLIYGIPYFQNLCSKTEIIHIKQYLYAEELYKQYLLRRREIEMIQERNDNIDDSVKTWYNFFMNFFKLLSD